jgi:hypothetical protein
MTTAKDSLFRKIGLAEDSATLQRERSLKTSATLKKDEFEDMDSLTPKKYDDEGIKKTKDEEKISNSDKKKKKKKKMKENTKTSWAEGYEARYLEPGLCKYDNETILLRKETISRMQDSFKGKPVVIQHQNPDPADNENIHGYITDVYYNPDDNWFYCKYILTTDESKTLVANGYSISCAYTPLEFSQEGGEWHNINYDKEVLNGELNHLALVDNPRYEDAITYKNSKDGVIKKMFKLFQNKKEEQDIDLKNSFVQLDEKEIPLNDLLEAFKNAKEEEDKENAKTMVNMSDEVEVDGKPIKVSTLVDNYKKTNKCGEKKNEEEKTEEEEKDKKGEKQRDNSKDDEKAFEDLKNAKEKGEQKQQYVNSVVTAQSGYDLGKKLF